jgi:hypothetical protein
MIACEPIAAMNSPAHFHFHAVPRPLFEADALAVRSRPAVNCADPGRLKLGELFEALAVAQSGAGFTRPKRTSVRLFDDHFEVDGEGFLWNSIQGLRLRHDCLEWRRGEVFVRIAVTGFLADRRRDRQLTKVLHEWIAARTAGDSQRAAFILETLQRVRRCERALTCACLFLCAAAAPMIMLWTDHFPHHSPWFPMMMLLSALCGLTWMQLRIVERLARRALRNDASG